MLVRLPADRAGWRPHPRSRSLGEQAEHLVALLGYATNLAAAPGHELTRSDSRPRAAGSPSPGSPSFFPPDLLPRFSVATATTSRLLSSLDPATLDSPWTLSRGGLPIATLPRGVALQVFLISHLRHHTAQLEFCLRLAAVSDGQPC